MRDKPALPAPGTLADAGRAEWEALHDVFEFPAYELAIVEAMCKALDRAADAATEIAANGQYRKNRFDVLEENPACDTERKSLDLYRRLRRELNLDLAPSEDRAPRRA